MSDGSGAAPRNGIELDPPESSGRGIWIMQRGAWVLLLLVLVAAAAGAFGGGPLGWRRLQSADGALVVEYERCLRAYAVSPLRVRVPNAAEKDLAVRFDRGYLDGIAMRSVVPAPLRAELADGTITFVFDVQPPGRAVIEFELEARSAGRHVSRLGVGAAEVELRQFALP
jgi:hypothetical protein